MVSLTLKSLLGTIVSAWSGAQCFSVEYFPMIASVDSSLNLIVSVSSLFTKLQWYGHVSRSSGLAKIIWQGTVKGRRRQGRQRKRWEDSIRECTGLEFAMFQRAVENREKWRTLVVKSSAILVVKGLMMMMMNGDYL